MRRPLSHAWPFRLKRNVWRRVSLLQAKVKRRSLLQAFW
jgi:hypothetical protein